MQPSKAIPAELRMGLSELDKTHIQTIREKYNIQKLPDIYRFALANLVNAGTTVPNGRKKG